MNICAKIDCGQPATHVPSVSVPAQGVPIDMHQPAKLIVALPCCEVHARGFDTQDWFARNSSLRTLFQKMISSTRLGTVLADFPRAFVEPLPISHPDAQRLLARELAS